MILVLFFSFLQEIKRKMEVKAKIREMKRKVKMTAKTWNPKVRFSKLIWLNYMSKK